VATSTCPTCGRTLDEHDRDVRFTLPDPVLDLPKGDTTEGVWMSGSNARVSVMMQVPGAGAFIRALLPVKLTGGYTVTYGVWVGIHPEDLQRAFTVWWAPEYVDLRLSGRLANRIQPWGLLAAPVELGVLDADATPYCVSSRDPTLAAVLAQEWDHTRVLDTLPQ
jgi:hypothetical protein